MNMNHMTQEQISAFADGALDEIHVDGALAALRQPDGQAVWDLYHQIGDALRSEEMAFTLSDGFAARMAARLEAEPAIVAPKLSQLRPEQQLEAVTGLSAGRSIVRYAMAGGAAVAVAALALISTPQLMVAFKDSPANVSVPIMMASKVPSVVPAVAQASQVMVATGTENGSVVMRDPRIDEYLLAHQRFSPSLYSTAQYARSTTFATDSEK
jgi:sigma-E factor negative regulatory protein RseA